MITAEIIPGGMAMTGNPIIVKVNAPNEAFVQLTITHDNNEIFIASAVPDVNNTCEFRIEDLLKDIVYSSLIESNELLVPVNGMSATYTLTLKGGTSEQVVNLSGSCFTGGAAKNELRKFSGVNLLETFKIQNSTGNFFLTTRTQKNVLTLRESEIYPLYFVHPGGTIKIEDSSENTIILPAGEARKPYALNLPIVRKQFLEAGTLSNYFKVYVDDIEACSVVLTPAVDTDDRYLLQFKNSYGAYERIEVTGLPSLESKYDSSTAQFNKYDYDIKDFTSASGRVKSTRTIKTHSGYKAPEEIQFINDLLASDDIYLLTTNADLFNVLVTAQKIEQKLLFCKDPESIQLNIQFIDQDSNNTPHIVGDTIANRIFSVQFDNTFN